jgi:hypothetical protein
LPRITNALNSLSIGPGVKGEYWRTGDDEPSHPGAPEHLGASASPPKADAEADAPAAAAHGALGARLASNDHGNDR